MTVTVTLTGGNVAFGVTYDLVVAGATVADGDYVATSGTLTFGANVNTQTISVLINGDTKKIGRASCRERVYNPTNGATITNDTGTGTILNDDSAPVAGSISIANQSLTEGDSGT